MEQTLLMISLISSLARYAAISMSFFVCVYVGYMLALLQHNMLFFWVPDGQLCLLFQNDPDVDTDSSSQAGFFCGSPPARTDNPVINDPQFGKKTPSFSPLFGGSSSGKMTAGRVEVGSPSSCGASSPKVRIEGFACGNKEPPHCFA